jgi:hypothetical protein
MKIELDRLRTLFQGYAASKRPPDRRGCPSPRAMAGSFEASFSRRVRKKIADHISECPYCQEEFMIFLEARRSEAGALEPGDQVISDQVRPLPQQRPGGSGLAVVWQYACVLIGLSLAISSLFIVIQQKHSFEVQRSKESGILLLFPRASQVITAPPIFRWRGSPAVDYYVLELFDEAMLPIWTSERIRSIQAALPRDVFSGLRPGKSYYWMVTGFSLDLGTEESGLSQFSRGHRK